MYNIISDKKNFMLNRIAIAAFLIFAVPSVILFQLGFLSLYLLITGVAIAFYLAFALKIADQWEKAVVLRMGKFIGLKGPGLFVIIPILDHVDKYVDQRVRVTDFQAEMTLTKDTVPVNVVIDDTLAYDNGDILNFMQLGTGQDEALH